MITKAEQVPWPHCSSIMSSRAGSPWREVCVGTGEIGDGMVEEDPVGDGEVEELEGEEGEGEKEEDFEPPWEGEVEVMGGGFMPEGRKGSGGRCGVGRGMQRTVRGCFCVKTWFFDGTGTSAGAGDSG